jgi:multimeric flavodoxin WrbA
MIIRKLGEYKPKILVFQGSPRREDSCAGMDSKSHKVVEYLIDKWSPFADLEAIDLSVGKLTIQPCKGCISTAGGFHCHWSCSCYVKGDKEKPDLMYEANIYEKLEQCDGFLVVSPIHWYSVSSHVKMMFDRLVCANLTLTKEEALKILGEGNLKNPDITGPMELSKKYSSMLRNHLKGKWAAFYIHGDNGGSDYEDRTEPQTGDIQWDVRNSVMPLVYQCRYSEINCPDDLVEAFYINKGLEYYESNIKENPEMNQHMDLLIERLIDYIKYKRP